MSFRRNRWTLFQRGWAILLPRQPWRRDPGSPTDTTWLLEKVREDPAAADPRANRAGLAEATDGLRSSDPSSASTGAEIPAGGGYEPLVTRPPSTSLMSGFCSGHIPPASHPSAVATLASTGDSTQPAVAALLDTVLMGVGCRLTMVLISPSLMSARLDVTPEFPCPPHAPGSNLTAFSAHFVIGFLVAADLKDFYLF